MEQADPQPVNLVHGPWNTLLGKFCLKTALRKVFSKFSYIICPSVNSP